MCDERHEGGKKKGSTRSFRHAAAQKCGRTIDAFIVVNKTIVVQAINNDDDC